MPSILLTGATGYIGRRLEQVLRVRNDITLRLLVRNAEILTAQTRQQAEIHEGYCFRPAFLQQALVGIDTAIYLIHSEGTNDDCSRLDRTSAENFYQACLAQGVRKIIYLGGWGQEASTRAHFASRREIGEILSSRPDRIRTIWFRAGMIIGSGSTSFEMIHHLVKKLPFLIAPKWTRTLIQPIGIDDVISYLNAALSLEPTHNLVVDLGGPPITFMDMMRKTASTMGLRRRVLPVPFLSPRLSSSLLTLATPVPFRIGAALVKGLSSETLAQNGHAGRYFPEIRPAPFHCAVQKAISEMENNLVLSRWCDSSAGGGLRSHEAGSNHQSIFRDMRVVSFAGIPAPKVFAAVTSLGGTTGWGTYTFLWQLRGWVDKAMGGYGLNRGRRNSTDLRLGDALDFWKVADIVPNRRLLLLAQMKLPGKGWLEFDLQHETLVQTALFLPQGFLGRVYWYAMIPFHSFIFKDLCRKIVQHAAQPQQNPPSQISREGADPK